jgi:hypothetical protein
MHKPPEEMIVRTAAWSDWPLALNRLVGFAREMIVALHRRPLSLRRTESRYANVLCVAGRNGPC